MNRFLTCMAALAVALPLAAQQKAPASPPETATGSINGHTITIKYSSPRVNGREGHIFGPGGLIQKTHKQYPIWRAGANAATSLHTDANLTIGTLNVPAGDYTLFVDISNPDQWNLIVNKKTGEWGLAYDASQDLGKTPMTMSKPPSMVEDLEWSIGDGKITLSWEDHTASVNVSAQ
ncbi:MAG: DUF2911 domain-containing protein [Acidobacteriaceae bacterium]